MDCFCFCFCFPEGFWTWPSVPDFLNPSFTELIFLWPWLAKKTFFPYHGLSPVFSRSSWCTKWTQNELTPMLNSVYHRLLCCSNSMEIIVSTSECSNLRENYTWMLHQVGPETGYQDPTRKSVLDGLSLIWNIRDAWWPWSEREGQPDRWISQNARLREEVRYSCQYRVVISKCRVRRHI